MATISTHNGTQAHQNHNIRDEKCVSKEPHIDPNGEHETWHHENVRDAYHRLFDEAQKEYNDKQKRDDRKIDDYYTKIQNDKQKNPCYEMIIGVYGNGDKQTEKEIMREFVNTWQERNPNLELIGAYYHADEKGEPHCHIDYIPIAYNCTRGMEVQTGLNAALKEQGIEKGSFRDTPQIQWERQQNQYLERLCRDRGIEVEHPQRGLEREERAEHLDTIEYKLQAKEKELYDRIMDFNDKAEYINKHYQDLDRAEEYCSRIEKYCSRTGQSVNDYYVHEFWADRGVRQHQYPEIYNPSRTEQEREEIREYYEQDRDKNDRDIGRDRG